MMPRAEGRRSPPFLDSLLDRIPEPRLLEWNLGTLVGLFTIVCLWAALLVVTWARWGDVTVDCGREMYVPWQLLQGKTLYVDLWYPYGPLAPYLNSVLFRFAGLNLNVLYWAGALSGLACAVLLYLIGMQLSSTLAGWTAAAILLSEVFGPTIFSFPLPYSFSAVYGAVAACLCFWFSVNSARSAAWGWVFAATLSASAAMLSKPEIGFGCVLAVIALIVLRAVQSRSYQRLLQGILAALPGMIAFVLTVGWMISLGGAQFLIEQNLTGFPSTYFLKEYGTKWNHFTGMAFDDQALRRVSMSNLAILWLFAVRLIVRRYSAGWRVFVLVLGGAIGFKMIAVRIGVPLEIVRSIFFPPAMVFLILAVVPMLIFLLWRTKITSGIIAVLALTAGSGFSSIRTLFGTLDSGYSIYYNGPVILSFLSLATFLTLRKETSVSIFARPAESAPFLALIIVVAFPLIRSIVYDRPAMEPWRTNRGLIFLHPGMPERYEAAVGFIQAAAVRGDSTLSVPEDVSLYFFSGTQCPLRFYALTPGLISPKQLNDLIAQIERRHVRYLIWSNRRFDEYGTPEFGKDFYQPLGDYLRSHYRPISSFAGHGPWSADIWERIPASQNPSR